jgi:UMF1 family MFS transporter
VPDDIDYVSSKGYALGYLGGGILLAVNIAMIQVIWAGSTLGPRLSFVTVAIWWAIFSLPLFRHVPEPPANTAGIGPGVNPVAAGFRAWRQTFREIRKYRQLFFFLIAFWLYNDGIGTIIKMATIYGSEIGIGMIDLIGALLLTQFVGIPFSLLFGRSAGRIGTKRSIMLGLGWYTLISIAGLFHEPGLALLGAGVHGGDGAGWDAGAQPQPVRSDGAQGRSAEFFGFYDISSKFAGIAGPALFALVGQLTGSSRLSIIALIVFFIGGILLLTRVDEKEGIRVAEEENRAAEAA